MTEELRATNLVAAVIPWLTEWEAALTQSRATRRPVLIDVWKDP